MTKNVPGEYAHLTGDTIRNEWVVDLLEDINDAVTEFRDHYAETWGGLPEIVPYGPQDRMARALTEILRRQGVSLTWKWVGLDD